MRRILMTAVIIAGLGLVVAFFAALQFTEPDVESTNLGGEDFRDLLQAYSTLEVARPEPAQVELGLNQASYLVENHTPEGQWYGWEIDTMSLEPAGELMRLNAVLQGPLGIYGLATAEGVLRLRDGRWWFTVDQAYLGSVPLRLVLPEEWELSFPTRYLNGELILHEVTVRGSGVDVQAELTGSSGEAPGMESPPEEDPVGDLIQEQMN